MNFDPYVTADTDRDADSLDWSEFDPAAGTGAFVTAAQALVRRRWSIVPTGSVATILAR